MKNKTTITFELERSTSTNTILMTSKIDLIKQIKEFTMTDLRTAKNIVDELAQALVNAQPDDRQTRLKINDLVADLQGADLLDILRFITVTMKPKPTNDFTPEPIDPVKETWLHHNCEDACRHQCEYNGCERMVTFHDEPFCFTHSPDEGSSVPGYDSRNKRV